MPDDVKPASPLHSEAFNGVLLEPSIHGVLAVSDGTVLFGLTWEQALRLSEWVSRVSRYTLIKASPQNRPTFTDLRNRVAALEAELAQEKQDHADDLDALASVRAERDRLRKALGLLTTDDVAEWLEANKHARAALAPKEPS